MAGIQYLHTQGVFHRDLSPENIMINHDGCLMIDMGMAICIPYTDPNKSNDPANVTSITRGTQRWLIQPQGACGKLPYMSPKMYRSQQPFNGGAVNIWMAGTILFCVVTGNESYKRLHNLDPQYYWMMHGLE
jgi:serine/threonine protein kinase